MSFISKIKISPSGGTDVEYDIKDANAQPATLSTPIVIGGNTKTTVEDALDALNNESGGGGFDPTGQDTNNVLLVTANEL
jgi:hypothetical protein